jgi:hypothetical protein
MFMIDLKKPTNMTHKEFLDKQFSGVGGKLWSVRKMLFTSYYAHVVGTLQEDEFRAVGGNIDEWSIKHIRIAIGATMKYLTTTANDDERIAYMQMLWLLITPGIVEVW